MPLFPPVRLLCVVSVGVPCSACISVAQEVCASVRQHARMCVSLCLAQRVAYDWAEMFDVLFAPAALAPTTTPADAKPAPPHHEPHDDVTTMTDVRQRSRSLNACTELCSELAATGVSDASGIVHVSHAVSSSAGVSRLV